MKIKAWNLGVCLTVVCVALAILLMPFLYDPTNPSGGDNFILVIITFIAFGIGITKAPIVVHVCFLFFPYLTGNSRFQQAK
jgi:hypothetical protein